MSKVIETDICVIGAGSGGLSLAAGASQMGAKVVLIERGKMGGDCLNYGCVPSKALLAAAKNVAQARHGRAFGLTCLEPRVSFLDVHTHVHQVIDALAPHDSQERFETLGVQVLREEARFLSPESVKAGAYTVKAKYFVIATGSSPHIPDLKGLSRVPYLTNETIFDLKIKPEHLIILGGGPIGVEMAQAHRRLGSYVSLIARHAILPKDEAEAVQLLRQVLAEEEVRLYENTEALSVSEKDGIITLDCRQPGGNMSRQGTHLLIATGRKPNLEALDLEKAGVAYTAKGIVTDARLRTSARRIYALGDVTGPYQFTHMAGYQAGIILRNILFKWPAKTDYGAVPWVTYTDPELAHAGLTEAEAEKKGMVFTCHRWPLSENDRAQAERSTRGFIKILVSSRGKILGATLIGPHAGELLLPWVLAIQQNLKIRDMAGVIVPYPTFSEVSKRVAGSYYTPKLFSDKTKRLVRFLMRWG